MSLRQSKLQLMILGIAGLSALAIAPAQAHPLDIGLLSLTHQGLNFAIRLELNPAVAAKLLKLSPSLLSPQSLASRAADLFQRTLGSGSLSFEGQACRWENAVSTELINPQNLVLIAHAQCERNSGKLTLNLPFLKQMEETFNLLIRAEINGVEHVSGADSGRTRVEISLGEPEPSFTRFVGLGLEHIGVAPNQWRTPTGRIHLPFGVDHILFVLALILGGAGMIDLLRTITGFTLGHSVALLVATLGYVQFSGHWIEAAIALTIAFVAAANVFGWAAQHRWKVTIGIGLIHGLGFAAALSELRLSQGGLAKAVVGFNIGVELGQALIVCLIFPVVIGLGRTSVGRKYVLRGASLSIFLLSGYWFIERAFP